MNDSITSKIKHKLPQTLKLKSNSKINLGLWIKDKRPDGYHEIETVFFENELLFDKIEIELLTDQKSIVNVDFVQKDLNKEIPLKSNIVYKAALLFFKKLGIDVGCNIKIDKKIPLQAGLGGGSSNAASVLKGLNQLFDFQLHESELLNLASELGSDVSFFIKGKTCLGKGRGEILEEIENHLKLQIKIVKPENIFVSTEWAYEQIDAREFIADRKEEVENLITAMRKNDYRLLCKNVFNDFENVVFSYHPDLIKERKKLLDDGYDVSGLCGSGSALFGLKKL